MVCPALDCVVAVSVKWNCTHNGTPFCPLSQSYNTAMMTDAVLYFHPHVIAIGCILYSAALLGIDLRSWAETLNVDMEEVCALGAFNRSKRPVRRSRELFNEGHAVLAERSQEV